MGKYEPLKTFLTTQALPEAPMGFHDIERVIGAPLPPAAFKHRAWWSNNPTGSAITKAWLAAGYKAERVDMTRRKLVFSRGDERRPSSRTGRHPIFGAMKGTVTFVPGVDLTEPADPDWKPYD